MRRYPLTPTKLARWIKEGRGTGEGAAYQSWLRFEDFPSKGAMARPEEGRHGRRCVVFSEVELELFHYLDTCPQVVELYDQYKLDFDETQAIAKDLGIDHPGATSGGMVTPMTSDLVAHVKTDKGIVKVPFQCKHSSDLLDFNSAEHMEIERRYWLARKTPLRIVSESTHCISKAVRGNVMTLVGHRFVHREKFDRPPTYAERSELVIKAVLTATKSATLSELARDLAAHTMLPIEQFNKQIGHLIYRGHLVVDLSRPDMFSHDVLDVQRRTIARRQSEGTELHRSQA